MLFLQISLLLTLLPCGDSENGKNSVQKDMCVCTCVCVCVCVCACRQAHPPVWACVCECVVCMCVWSGFPNLEIENISLVSFQYHWLQVHGSFEGCLLCMGLWGSQMFAEVSCFSPKFWVSSLWHLSFSVFSPSQCPFSFSLFFS